MSYPMRAEPGSPAHPESAPSDPDRVPEVSHAFAFANRLLIAATLPSGAVPDTIYLAREGEPPRRCAVLGVAASGESAVVVAELLETLPFRLFGAPFALGLARGAELLASGEVTTETLPLGAPDGAGMDHARAAAQAGLLPAEASLLLDEAFDWTPAVPFHFHSDVSAPSTSGFGVAGWFANAGSRRIMILTEDGVSLCAEGTSWRVQRPDVSAHLASVGITATTDLHGLLFAFSHASPGCEAFWIADLTASPPRAHGPVRIPRGGEPSVFVDTAWAHLGQGGLPAPQVARELLLPFFLASKPEPKWRTIAFGPEPDGVRLSVIVPFYKDAGFIRSIVTMQSWFPPEFEWVLVCDDPAIFSELLNHLTCRSEFLKCRIVLVRNEENYGYSAANNIGAKVARGGVLVLMNSDVWAESAGPFLAAEALLRGGAWHVLGMRLLYEDGTIQHDGMAFESYPFMRGLYVADHPAKGLPPRDEDTAPTVREVSAVTGALMMTTRATFEKLGGLDESFIKGDFEDADLCLRARAQGGRIGVLTTDEVFHLERQSIRLMGGNSTRMAITYLNCIKFNHTWAGALRGHASAR